MSKNRLTNKSTRKQGQGPSTPWKGVGFRGAIWKSLTISMNPPIIREYPYWFGDMNSGEGTNPLAGGCEGSPLVFVKTAEEFDRPYKAFFCDHDRQAIHILQSILQVTPIRKGNYVTCWCGDNAEFLQRLDKRICRDENPRKAVGAILSDPNGPGPEGFPIRDIANFANKFDRIDTILNVNLTVLLKVQGIVSKKPHELDKHCRGHYQSFQRWPIHNLREIIETIPKKYWMIRNPCGIRGPSGGGDDFTIIVGSNKDPGSWKDLGFYRHDSGIGKDIIQNMKRVDTHRGVTHVRPLSPFSEELK